MVMVLQNGVMVLQVLGCVHVVGNNGGGGVFCSVWGQLRFEVSAARENKVTRSKY